MKKILETARFFGEKNIKLESAHKCAQLKFSHIIRFIIVQKMAVHIHAMTYCFSFYFSSLFANKEWLKMPKII